MFKKFKLELIIFSQFEFIFKKKILKQKHLREQKFYFLLTAKFKCTKQKEKNSNNSTKTRYL